MSPEFPLPLFDLVTCVSGAIDLFSPLVANHHMRVASVASAIAEQMGLPPDVQNDLLLAGALHDVGGFSSNERADLMQFEIEAPHHHGRAGHTLLKGFPPFSRAARFVRFHHVHWDSGRGVEFENAEVAFESHLLHLADRISVLIRPGEPTLTQAERVREKILSQTPEWFMPDQVQAFLDASTRDAFWMDAASPMAGLILGRRANLPQLVLDRDSLMSLANLFRRLIDFRSRFTARHSKGVSAAAAALARVAGFGAEDVRLMEIAGHFHDLGKLAIPSEILEKPGRLTALEYDVMRSHAWHTYRLLETAPALDTIRVWGALHQERLDGSGYPFGLKGDQMPFGARIMAVADIFAALTEVRPYRDPMPPAELAEYLKTLAAAGKIDGDLVSLLARHYEEIDSFRREAQADSEREYLAFVEETA
ncbi:MAG TPA: HD domain-containing phosphohydrolase [Candidatus Bathyarchaeia archaeon]|nr:HD domain-containing phosphohydrolase [Candidatus Bathyarchaeia archaeon]